MPRNYRFEEIMSGRTHARHSQARIEVRKHEEMIRRCVDEGYTIKSLWEALTERALVTVSYSAFRRQANALLDSSQGTSTPGTTRGAGNSRDNLSEEERGRRILNNEK